MPNQFLEKSKTPLAERMRPVKISEILGQDHILGEGKILHSLIKNQCITSMIFYGPPGTGKTTIAKAIAKEISANFIELSAINSGVKDIRETIKAAKENTEKNQTRTIVFIDEIHRFNKAQQDALLPCTEDGTITLIGATTENPSFEVNHALLSRCKVFILKQVSVDDLVSLLERAIKDERGFKELDIVISRDILRNIAIYANGDVRTALNTLELLILNSYKENEQIEVSNDLLKQVIMRKNLLYDKNGEEHYNLISALHKSLRNSDPDAAVYWLTRMLEAGEEPLYIARRLIRFASEDVGLADPNAINMAVSAYQACHYIGMPECGVNLAHVVIYLAITPKSNAVYMAYNKAKEDALNDVAEPVPLHIRNAPTKFMDQWGYGKGYQYSHDFEKGMTSMQCLPDNLVGKEYYQPTNRGSEEKIAARLKAIKEWKQQKR